MAGNRLRPVSQPHSYNVLPADDELFPLTQRLLLDVGLKCRVHGRSNTYQSCWPGDYMATCLADSPEYEASSLKESFELCAAGPVLISDATEYTRP